MVSLHGGAPWSKSRALLGSISNVDRARVSDLSNPDPDQPLAAHFRVHSWHSVLLFYCQPCVSEHFRVRTNKVVDTDPSTNSKYGHMLDWGYCN